MKDYFRKLVDNGLKNLNEAKYNCLDYDEAKSRIDYECGIIEKYDLYGYFLNWYNIMSLAKENGISTGTGRGRAMGSVVCYCLGITKADPTEVGLSSELFLSDERHSPTISVDVSYKNYNKLIEHIIKKFGANRVAKISTYKKGTKEIAGVYRHALVIGDFLQNRDVPIKMTEDGLVILLDREDCKTIGLNIYNLLGLRALDDNKEE